MPPKPAAEASPADASTSPEEDEEPPLPDIALLCAKIISPEPMQRIEGIGLLLALEHDALHIKAMCQPYEGEAHEAWVRRQEEIQKLKDDDAYDSDEERPPDPEPELRCPQGIVNEIWTSLKHSNNQLRKKAAEAALAASDWPQEARVQLLFEKLMQGLWACATFVEYEEDEETGEKTPLPPSEEVDSATLVAIEALSSLCFSTQEAAVFIGDVEAPRRKSEVDGDGFEARARAKGDIIRLLGWDRKEEVAMQAARLVWYCGRYDPLNDQLVEANVTNALVAVLQPKPLPPPPEGEEGGADGAKAPDENAEPPPREFRGDDCIIAACDALSRYLGEPSWVQSDAVNAGVVETLIEHTGREDNVMLQVSATHALANMLKVSKDACARFHAVAGFPVLWSMLPMPPAMPEYIEIEEPIDTTERDLLFMKSPFLTESELRLEEARIEALEAAQKAARDAVINEANLLVKTDLHCPGPALDSSLQVNCLRVLQALLADQVTRQKLAKKQNIVHVLLYMLTPPPPEVEEEEEEEEEEEGEGSPEGEGEGAAATEDDIKTDDEIAAERAAVTQARDDAVANFAAVRDAIYKLEGIAELRSYHRPPPSCSTVVQALLQVLGEPLSAASDWNQARRRLVRALLAKIVAIDASRDGGSVGEDINNPTRKAWKKAAATLEGVSDEKVKAASGAAYQMLLWLQAGVELARATVEAERLEIEEKELPALGSSLEGGDGEEGAAAAEEKSKTPTPPPEESGEDAEGEEKGDDEAALADVPEELIPPFTANVRGDAAGALQCAAMHPVLRQLLSDNVNGELSIVLEALTEDCPTSVADPMALLITALAPHCDAKYLEDAGVLHTLCALARVKDSNKSMRSAVARAILCFEASSILAPLKEVPPLPPPKPPPRPLPTGSHLWDALGARKLVNPLDIKPSIPGRVC
ncbi:hypothetical protein NFJ02_15g21780 [Pycnococcus provasolii]